MPPSGPRCPPATCLDAAPAPFPSPALLLHLACAPPCREEVGRGKAAVDDAAQSAADRVEEGADKLKP